jgi:Mg2+/Co2+ transporter CorC
MSQYEPTLADVADAWRLMRTFQHKGKREVMQVLRREFAELSDDDFQKLLKGVMQICDLHEREL